MPGYHGTKVSFQPEFHMPHQPRSKEVLYPRHFPMGKMAPMPMPANPMGHPMFEALRSRHAHDKNEYARMMRARDLVKMGGDIGYPTFDSLKLLGSDNDSGYLDGFMNENAKHHHHQRYPSDDSDIRPRTRSCSQTNSNKSNSSKRNSMNVDSIKKTILGSLRSAASDENIYESVEVIQYRKTIEAIKRHNKLRSVPKTGHPLFDHLRQEKVMKTDRHHHRSNNNNNNNNSDGGSNSQSSSGSGDEFDYTRKPNCRFSRKEVLMSSRGGEQQQQQQTCRKNRNQREAHMHKNPKRDSRQNESIAEAGSESDDDWAIPRPKICGGAAVSSGTKGRSRRTGASGLAANGSHEESDSSSKSTGLR